MRELEKRPKPAILVTNEEEWTRILLEAIARGEDLTVHQKSRYRHQQIKTELLLETDEKCAYCESKVRHITYGDIEHIIPKSTKPELSFDWSNLTLACDVCNTNKGTFYEVTDSTDESVLIDPYNDIPTEHFMFIAEYVEPRPDSTRGYLSDKVIQISRPELNERRRERLVFINGLIRAICLSRNSIEKNFLIDDLYNNHLKESEQYSVASSKYVELLRDKGVF